MDNLLIKYIEELQQINTVEEYETCMQSLYQMLHREGCTADIIHTIRNRGRYTINKFSDDSTRESMMKSKERLVFYLESILYNIQGDQMIWRQECLREYLHHFYLFLEAFREGEPHKKATLDIDGLQNVQIKNEYDLQHILYAVLKPLCIDARVEVSEDTGFGMVRSDIKIPSLDTIIETKCTRGKMSLKKLTEEIEADIVHYQAKFIYFYIYDKEKIVKNKQAFEETFHKKFDGKTVEAIVLQPVNM